MEHDTTPSAADTVSANPLRLLLERGFKGLARFDNLARAIYATDAGIHEIVPIGVAYPKDIDDVIVAINACRATQTPLIARGAGTGLTGGAVGAGLQLDLSRHMNRIGPLDVERRTISVEPGVVLDELNAHLEGHGLMFAPDVATASRATIGGMIANNSCGAHSLLHGRTVDHVAELKTVLADGNVVRFSAPHPTAANNDLNTRETEIRAALTAIRDEYAEEIRLRFPKILRSNAGYGLDRLGERGTPIDVTKILCGSEGTLGVVVDATLRLVPVAPHKGLAVLPYSTVHEALAQVPSILTSEPAAIELIDRMIIHAGRTNPQLARRCDFLTTDPGALLIVEFQGEEAGVIDRRIDRLLREQQSNTSSGTATKIVDPDRQADVWAVRNSGLGLLMSKPGDEQTYSFVEDTAVPTDRLGEYIERFSRILSTEGVQAGYYAHASVGCIHVRPVLNLKTQRGVDLLRRIADAVSDLALEFGGTMTGEHGDGLVRSCWLEKMYGPRIIEAFVRVKTLFDPDKLLNPNKIVDPLPMNEHLRYGPTFQSSPVKSRLDFAVYGGMAGLAGMCSGVGQCRQTLVGTMCPSFIATGDEMHTTRARANALRMALSNRGLIDGLDDVHLEEVMDLCIACKACKTECPTGVDMARLKSEYLSHRILRHGASRRDRLIADFPDLARRASRFPRLANLVARSGLARGLAERRFGLDKRIPPPRFATKTFRRWFRGHARKRPGTEAPRGTIIYFVDTWTDYFVPQVGIAAVRVLERLGYEVRCPHLMCCGRPAISKGFLAEAAKLAESNVLSLAPLTRDGTLIVGTEPSCILTFVDEYPQLVRNRAARRIASQTVMIETLIWRILKEDPSALAPRDTQSPLLYHAHCHQKAIVGSEDARAVLGLLWGESAREIDAGCCGMAGSFGHEKEHYEVARAIGEHRLFPVVRARGDADVAVSGFSCRQQIEHHTGAPTRHLVEYLADACL